MVDSRTAQAVPGGGPGTTKTAVWPESADSSPAITGWGRMGLLVVWAILAFLANSAVTAATLDLSVLGYLAVASCAWIYLQSGGARLDAVGVWALAGLLFVGVAALLVPEPVQAATPAMPLAVTLAILVILGVTAIAWWPTRPVPPSARREPRSRLMLSSGALTLLGLMSLVIGLGLQPIPILSNFADGFVWLAPLLTTLGVASSRQRPGLRWLAPAAVAGVILAKWSGDGRITILSVVLGMIMAQQAARPPKSHLIKLIVLPALIPALFVAALIEVNRNDGARTLLSIPSDFSPADSLYSVWSPLRMFAVFLEDDLGGFLEHHGFHTLFASLTVVIPRGIWPEKPDGWGRELAWIYNPTAAATANQSEASILPGEFLWGFGLMSLWIGIPLVGLGVRLLVRPSRRIDVTPTFGWAEPRSLVRVVISAALVSLVWAGSHTFVGRAALQLIALAILVALCRLMGVARRIPIESSPSPPDVPSPSGARWPKSDSPGWSARVG